MSQSAARPVADALVVVDVQRGLVSGPHAVGGAEPFLDRVSAVLRAARATGATIVHLQDDGADEGSSIPRGTPGWELVLPVHADEAVLQKARDDGFDGTDLDGHLRRAGATRLCLVGIQSEMCVAATARGALARGYTVVLPRDTHTTYDVPADGPAPPVPAHLVARVAEWSLGDGVVAPDRAAEVEFRAGPG